MSAWRRGEESQQTNDGEGDVATAPVFPPIAGGPSIIETELSLGGWAVSVPCFGKYAKVARNSHGEISLEAVPTNMDLEHAEQLADALTLMATELRRRAGV